MNEAVDTTKLDRLLAKYREAERISDEADESARKAESARRRAWNAARKEAKAVSPNFNEEGRIWQQAWNRARASE